MRRLLAVLILLLAVGGFFLLKATRPAAPAAEVRERVWRVAALAAVPQTRRPVLPLYGRIEAPDRLEVAAPVGGRVLSVAVREGQKVPAGAELLRMDPRDLQPRLVLARAELERERIRAQHDRAALEQERTLLGLSEAKVARLEKLRSARLGAESVVDQAREERARMRLALTQREQAIAEHPARLAQREAQLAEAERDARRGAATAPFAARVGRVAVGPGDHVQAGETLLTLYPSDDIFLRARVPAIYAAELQAALASGEPLPASIQFGGRSLRAALVRIGAEADARGVDALLRVEEAAGVPVGAFANAWLERPAVAEVVALPFAALHGGDRVYRIDDGRLRAVRVERIGELREAGEPQMLVRGDGFAAGAQVMVTHLPNAIDGLAVTVVGE